MLTGQAVLLLVALLFLSGLLWLRRLAQPEKTDRLLGTGLQRVAAQVA